MPQIRDRLESVPYIGPKIAQKLADAGISSIIDLVYYLPRAWEDLSQITPISALKPAEEKFTIKAQLAAVSTFRSPVKRMYLTQGKADDGSGKLPLIWFNQPYLKTSLKAGKEYFFTGKVDRNRGMLQMVNPSFEAISDTPLHSGRIVPVYPEHGDLTSKIFRRIIKGILPCLRNQEETLPANLVAKYQLAPLNQALVEIHFPSSLEALQIAKDRLGFDELLTTQLTIQQIRNYLGKQAARPIPADVKLIKSTLARLPFSLTDSQKLALEEILQDLGKGSPANRLLEGDVGSGKTIIVAIAAIVTAKAGFESAVMVPTEVLAHQHFDKLKSLFEATGVSLALHTNAFNEGPQNADVTIGTHALIYDRIKFSRLNLVVIDEQHRFGVKQREALKNKSAGTDACSDGGYCPHFISLTATPIPRSLALGIFGDLDISIISERPGRRPKIITQVLSEDRRRIAYDKIRAEVASGHQAFIVVPLVEDSKTITAKSAESEFAYIKKEFPDLRIGLMHGRIDALSKQKLMQDFAQGAIDVLVATTVIEVGIDVPNATVMLIESAERFGLAQLHQLRGRVGRSDLQSYCFVIPSLDEAGIVNRLEEFSKLTDGFKLAELDLKMRGPGTLFGALQAGFMKYKLADWTDANAIKRARDAAKEMLANDPNLVYSPELAKRINIEDVVLHRE